MKKTGILVLIGLVICTFLYVTYKREFDQFNPFYKKETVYVEVNKQGKPEGKYVRYRYNLTGYTAQGNKKEITFSASNQLEQGTYVEVVAKGAYTSKWTIIKKEDVPSKALK